MKLSGQNKKRRTGALRFGGNNRNVLAQSEPTALIPALSINADQSKTQQRNSSATIGDVTLLSTGIAIDSNVRYCIASKWPEVLPLDSQGVDSVPGPANIS